MEEGGLNMRKERILKELKEELIEKINGLTYENADETGKNIQEFFKAIQSLHLLSFETKQVIKEEEHILVEEETIEPMLDPIEKVKKDEAAELMGNGMIGKIFKFNRRLSGGVISDLDGGYLLPEKMVRDMGLNDGDLLKVTDERIKNDEKKYTFDLFEKSKTTNEERIEISFCKVDKEAGEYVVKESMSGLIRLDEAPYTLILQEKDKQRLRLKEGDIVDVAFYRDNPSTVRVIWKHEIQYTDTLTEEERRLYSEHRNEKNQNEKNEKEYPIALELFKNRKVLIIGGEHRHADYQRAFQTLPIQLEMIKGTEETKRLKSAIDRADIVTIIIGEAKHRASIMAVQHCKDTGKPFDTTHENGIQSVLLCTENAIKKGIDQHLIEKVG